MKRTFENYLIMVGIRSDDYTYTDEQIFGNTEYFKKCYNDNLSAYKALLFLHDHLQELDTSETAALHIPVVSNMFCDNCMKWIGDVKKCPYCDNEDLKYDATY